jgi:hypothetical protein
MVKFWESETNRNYKINILKLFMRLNLILDFIY